MKITVFPRSKRLPALVAAAATLLAATGLRAETSVAVDVETGKVLSANNATARWYPASTTKLMTAYLAFKAMEAQDAALDTPVVMTRRAAGEAPSKMDYAPGSVIRLDNALRMMLVKSANDVAVAIGQTLADGSLPAFVSMMNEEAVRLGMMDTRFINPNGLPGPGQYSSAKDLAILGIAIRREFPAFTEFFGTEAISTGTDTMNNGNKLLGRFTGADGMKTGYICASGFNLVSSATRDGRTVVAVVLGADGPITRERKAAAILETAFAVDPAKAKLRIEDMPVSKGAPNDISEAICSPEGRTQRANERVAESKRDQAFGSPYMRDLGRPPVAVTVGLGGAAGSDVVEPGISVIDAYGIPIPTFRPVRPEDRIAAEQPARPVDSAPAQDVDADDLAAAAAGPEGGSPAGARKTSRLTPGALGDLRPSADMASAPEPSASTAN